MLDRLVARYLRAPEHPGKLRVVRALGRTLIPRQGVVTDVLPEIRLFLHPQDWIEYLLLRGASYEPLTLAFLERNLAKGDTAVLAGVNFGLHVAVAARAVGSRGLILGVEPQPAAILRAKENLKLNGLDGCVKLVQGALGASDALVPMAWSNQSNPGAASLFDSGPAFMVQMLTIKRLLANTCKSRPRLVLLDIQGYEFEALAGLDTSKAPDIVVVELDKPFLDRAGVSAEDVASRLVDLQYGLYDLYGHPAQELLALPERNLIGVRADSDVSWAPI